MASNEPLILCVDDDPDILGLLEMTLDTEGYRVMTASNGGEALKAAVAARPDLILLDYMMPGMNGIELASRLQQHPVTDHIPIVFLTAVTDEGEKARAFSVGAVGYLFKPVDLGTLKAAVREHLKTSVTFEALSEGEGAESVPAEVTSWSQRIHPTAFREFREFVTERFGFGPESAAAVANMTPASLYPVARRLGLAPAQIAGAVADYLDIGLLQTIVPREVRLGVLPTPFCRSNLVVPIQNHVVGNAFVVSNPFDWNLLETLENVSDGDTAFNLVIAEPDTVLAVFEAAFSSARRRIEIESTAHAGAAVSADPITAERQPVAFVADDMLVRAIQAGADEIRFEPGDARAEVKLIVDGEAQPLVSVGMERGAMLTSRLKALAGMNISEKRRPQRGSLEVGLDDQEYDLTVVTTPLRDGESLTARLIPVGQPPKTLAELGMLEPQVQTATQMMARPRGLILLAGPGGSGKTRTAHSLLSGIADATRAILTVEDPIEYRVAFASQQQVDERAGVTFATLIGAAKRRKPDVLFVGEIRDAQVARLVIEYARTTGLVIATVQAPDAIAAIGRLGELEVPPVEIADAVLCVISQRLVRTPCPGCRKVEPPTADESDRLSHFTAHVPTQVVHPAGCPQCGSSGRRGRSGVFEVLPMTQAFAGLLRTDAPLVDALSVIEERVGCLLCDSGLHKVRELELAPADVYSAILAERVDSMPMPSASTTRQVPSRPHGGHVLVVDDSDDTRQLMTSVLRAEGLEVTEAHNGVEGLGFLGVQDFDLILSDLNMPLMGGFDLFERSNVAQAAPRAILYSASDTDADEIRALRMGAMDYFRLPINPEILRLRVRRALG